MSDKEIEIVYQRLELIEAKIQKDIEAVSSKYETMDREIWELRTNMKTVHQHSADISALMESMKSIEKIIGSTKRELEAKMVTKEYLEEKKYKDWRFWIMVAGLVTSIAFGVFNTYKIYNDGKAEDVRTGHQKQAK